MPPFVGVKMIKPPIHSWFNARWFLSSGVCCLKKYEEFISFMVIILDILEYSRFMPYYSRCSTNFANDLGLNFAPLRSWFLADGSEVSESQGLMSGESFGAERKRAFFHIILLYIIYIIFTYIFCICMCIYINYTANMTCLYSLDRFGSISSDQNMEPEKTKRGILRDLILQM